MMKRRVYESVINSELSLCLKNHRCFAREDISSKHQATAAAAYTQAPAVLFSTSAAAAAAAIHAHRKQIKVLIYLLSSDVYLVLSKVASISIHHNSIC